MIADIVCRILELSGTIPAAILCYLPVKEHLRIPVKRLLLQDLPVLLVWILISSVLCAAFGLWTGGWQFFFLTAFIWWYQCRIDLPKWKTISVMLSVCALITAVTNLTIEINALFDPNGIPKLYSLQGSIIYILLCWIMLGVLWYPAAHAIRWLISEMQTPVPWYVFWILPLSFMALHILLRPRNNQVLYVGRLMLMYPILTLALVVLMLFCYFMFYLMARSLNENMQLHQENHLLQMQTAHYETLQKTIEDTRRTRHDMRHHLEAIQAFVNRNDMESLQQYMHKYMQDLPVFQNNATVFCANYAVNAILWFYAEKASRNHVDIRIVARMGEKTLIPEPELCVLLGNLLENAMDACMEQKSNRFVKVCIQQKNSAMLTLTVDNSAPKPPVWEKDRLHSTKHSGFGLGTESIRIIAKRYHGEAQFQWKENVFYASVLMNP